MPRLTVLVVTLLASALSAIFPQCRCLRNLMCEEDQIRRVVSARAYPKNVPPLCDSGIVEQTCSDLSPTEGTITSKDVEELFSASPGSASELWSVLNLPDAASCNDVCLAVKDYIGKVAILPPASDVACVNVGGDVTCDEYVGPDFLPTLGTKEDLPSSLIEKNDLDMSEEKPDTDEDDEDDEDNEEAAEARAKARAISERFHSGQAPGQDPEIMEYSTWELIKRTAYLFRIFPEEKHPDPSSLAETAQDSATSRWPTGGWEATSRAAADSKAYLIHAIASFNRKATKTQMARWFGKGVFSDGRQRGQILLAMNSVLSMIENVHFVPKGRECSPNTYAYVYPQAYMKCSPSEVNRKPCTKTTGGKFVFYLCPYYFKAPSEMVETLVHEGSHHATAKLDDVQFQSKTAYGRSTCKRLAKSKPRLALNNADSFCYYVQDVADQIRSTAGSDEPVEVTVPDRVSPPSPALPEPISPDTHEDDGEETCMRSGPTGMPKKMKPDADGNCQCKHDGLSCYDGSEKKCPFKNKGKLYPFKNHRKYAASCYTCSCKW